MSAAITREETPVALEGGGVELRMKEIGGDLTVAFVHLPEGTDLTEAVKGQPDDRCQCPHWGYLLKGRLKMRTASGDEVYEAGQAFYWAPGHVPLALTDVDYVDFSPSREFREVIDHVKARMG
ncbi:hypothetical protein OOK31_29240 [Streptomyces sp. NBC_00249]|uniref:hypothetical protein n=1 Tax=Streptomyces sp. NBC_00249 TaxID=2975690 RepID=UPI0022591318|nr:hypothetical protein [Streptomyces sp. NBC_00249]MCX5197929.1 hypothetical protein [Streptomyces sp. NBC_00249]